MAINRDKVLASAIKLLQGGKYEKAIGEFQKLVDDDPKDVRTILKIGDTHVKMGHREEAIKNYERVASIYSEQGFYLKAVAVFKQMLRVDSNLPEVHLKLAEMYQQLGLISDCLQHYQQVAAFYEQGGRTGDTLQILKRMVDLDPDNLPSRIKLAELFAQQGLNDDAISEFRSAAQYLKEQERFDDYVRVAERLIYFDPSAIDVTRELSKLYMQRGDAKLALGKLQICFKADPRDVETLTLIAQAFLEMGQVPKTVSVYKEMARIHEGQGKRDEALRQWNRVLELEPGDEEAKRGLEGPSAAPAPAPVPAAAPAAVAAAAPAAPRKSPEDEQIARLLTETEVYVKYGLKDKAIEHLQKIVASKPEHIEAHDRMRSLYQSMGNRQALVAQLRVLVQLGEQTGDERMAQWRADLETLTAAPPPSPPAAEVDDGAIIDVDESDDIVVEDELLDDASLISHELPPDENFSEKSEVDAIPVSDLSDPVDIEELEPAEVVADDDVIPDDAMIGMDSAEAPSHPDNEPILGAPDAAAPRASGFDEPSLGFSEEGEPLSLEKADELVARALEGFEDFDETSLGEGVTGEVPQHTELPSATDFAEPIPSQDQEQEGDDDELAAVAAAAAADFDAQEEAVREAVAEVQDQAGPGQPDEFDLGEGAVPPSEDMAATAMMSLSADEMNEIHRFISTDGDAVDTGTFAEPAKLDQVSEDLPDLDAVAAQFDDGFAEATVAVGSPSFSELQKITQEPSDAVQHTLPETPAFTPDAGASEELDLDAVAAAAAGGAAEEPPPAAEAAHPKLGKSDAAIGFGDDPANQFFEEEIEEAEFFIRQELYDEARDILTEILEDVPESPRAQWMKLRVDALEAGEPEPPPPWAQNILDDVADEVAGFLDDAEFDAPEHTEQVSVDEVLSQFKAGVKEVVSDDDADTHYDLGVAYREMGLHDDAITEFRMAAAAGGKRIDSMYLVGLTQLEKGDASSATTTFKELLDDDGANSEQRAIASYQLGVALEPSDPGAALAALQRAKELGCEVGDLDSRLAALAAGAGADLGSGDGAASKNIDYV